MKFLKFENISPIPSFPLWLTEDKNPKDYPLHQHNFTELVIVLNGQGLNITENESYPIHAGDVFIINRELAHSYTAKQSFEIANILFRFDGLQMPIDELQQHPAYHALFFLEPAFREEHQFKSCPRIPIKHLGEIRSIISRLKDELMLQPPAYKAAATAIFTELLVNIFRSIAPKSTPEEELVSRMAKALSYMEQSYSKKITLQSLASASGMSVRNFQRQFSATMKSSPMDYLLELRLKKAIQLLRTSSKSISEIALECGFYDGNYMAGRFKKVFNKSPGSYRD